MTAVKTNQRMRPALAVYIGVVIAAGLALVLAAAAHATSWQPYSWRLFILYTALTAFAEYKPLEWFSAAGSTPMSASWPFMVSIVFMAPLHTALITLVVVQVVVCKIQSPDRSWTKQAFNAAQHVLSVGLPFSVLTQLDLANGWLDRFSSVRSVLAILLVAALSMAANEGFVACVYALVEHRSALRLWQDFLAANWQLNAALLALTPNVLGATEVTAPILGVVLVAFWFTSKRLAERVVTSETDALTGVANRRGFERQSDYVLKRSHKQGHTTSLLQLDLNSFKDINDQLGHAIGDGVLMVVAERLNATRRAGDVVARLGGDEFVMLLQAPSSIEDAKGMAERLRSAIRQPLEVEGLPLTVDVSIGIAEYPIHAARVDELLAAADAAMYRSKKLANGPEVYAHLGYEESGPGRRVLVAELERAIERSELFLVYQPKLHLPTNTFVGVEALIRWNHPERGLLNPGMFMPVAEQTDVMIPLTNWVLKTALKQCATWHAEGTYLTVAVNVSARNLHHRGFFRVVTDLLENANVDPMWLELEITENTIVADPARTHLALSELRDAGIKIAIDDFGTGFSTLTTLATLPIDRIKIDKSFVLDMMSSPAADAIVKTLIDLAARLNIDVVAEGVETQEVLDTLGVYECGTVQGYYIGHPNAAATIADLCATRSIFTEDP
jgi:diguanylate cyclase (GGDEF)-like protein